MCCIPNQKLQMSKYTTVSYYAKHLMSVLSGGPLANATAAGGPKRSTADLRNIINLHTYHKCFKLLSNT